MAAKYFESTDRVAAERMAELLNKVSDYPKKGTRVGKGGPPIPDVYTPGAFGWTERACEAVGDDPDKPTLFQVKIPEELEAHASDGARRARLTAAERTDLDAKLTSIKPSRTRGTSTERQ